MLGALATILGFQLVGEVLSRLAGAPLPGPVVGLLLLVASCLIRPALADRLRPVVQGLLAHLSLFFVPAGVGVIAHLPLIRTHGAGLALALILSTVLAIAVGAQVFAAVARLTQVPDDE
ncbi:MAG: CidA/LrgA family protein [Paracoccus sp. (in: a-proteobacteria)]|uniref:CidA/LrgA family protein n=1 Tax=Paracoccus sp. TaxID=267 RepID=UPI0026DF81C1|nr:CidA/LrgA family protein [Paracoccus sp. (in: a-proteobacteria)]MDO5612304.1 CidA/LrgA family protein [Paracoccus sp. (in: a-proteobacteria)]